MVLADTSVWVRHFREGDVHLEVLLDHGRVWCHPFVIGELACGHLRDREAILSLLQRLHAAPVATHEEVLWLIETRGLMGAGLGLVDVHLLAASLLSKCRLWTLDKRLAKAAESLSVGYGRHSRASSGDA